MTHPDWKAREAEELERKRRYVRNAAQARDHACHWPGCERQVPPAKWGCYRHWMMLPGTIRSAIWGSYEPGQEQAGTPSHRYVEDARHAQRWIRENRQCDNCDGDGCKRCNLSGVMR